MTAMHSRKRSDCGLDGESCASLAALVRDLLAAYMHSRFVLTCVMRIDALVQSRKADELEAACKPDAVFTRPPDTEAAPPRRTRSNEANTELSTGDIAGE